jgi:uncharacterized membrane protein
MNSGRLVGIIALVVGIVVGLLAVAWVVTNSSSGGLSGGGAILGLGLAFLVLVAPLVGFGIFMIVQGGKQAGVQAKATEQRRLLDIVRSRGQVDITDLALEMQISQDDLRAMIHELVGLQVFSGYINWDKGVLYSSEASKLRELKKCENCGGEIELTGKGVVTCRFCGTEYFLS